MRITSTYAEQISSTNLVSLDKAITRRLVRDELHLQNFKHDKTYH